MERAPLSQALATNLEDETPGALIDPWPPNGGLVRADADLAWNLDEPGPGLPTTFDVYFGTQPTLGPGDRLGSTTNFFWELPLLAPATTYYWQILARRTGLTVGPVWQFTTRGAEVFEWSPIASPQWVNELFAVTLTARDSFGRLIPHLQDDVRLDAEDSRETGLRISPRRVPADAFTNGVWRGWITIQAPGTRVRLAADDDEYARGYSNPFEVLWANDLELVVAAPDDPVEARQSFTYTLTVTNPGPATATGVILSNWLPAEVQLLAVQPSQGSLVHTGAVVVVALGDLPAAARAVVTLEIQPLEASLTLTNTASVTGLEPDPNPANNTVRSLTQVAPASLTIQDASVLEGDSGTRPLNFTLTLSAPSSLPVSVQFDTRAGTATPGLDYVPTNGTLHFPPGSTSQTLVVPVLGDLLSEADETLTVQLFWPENAILIRSQAVGTIHDDDGIPGQVKRFEWSPVASPHLAGQPQPVRLRAVDAFGDTAGDFKGWVTLRGTGRALRQTSSSLLGDALPIESGTTDPRTVGLAFTPAADLRVTHVRHCFGSRVELWSEGGFLLASQAVTNLPGQWQETALPAPVRLRAGQRYRVGVFNDSQLIYHVAHPAPSGLASLHHACFWQGAAYPLSAESGLWYAVDLRFTGPTPGAVALAPTSAGPFTNGLWAGPVTVLEAAEELVLRADDGAGHIGDTPPLEVLPANDVSLALGVSQNPVPVGQPLRYTLRVRNLGPDAAEGVVVTNWLPPEVVFVSATPSQGTVAAEGGSLSARLGRLAGGTAATVTIEVIPTVAGVVLTNRACLEREGVDPAPDNDTAEAVLAVHPPLLITAPPQGQTVFQGGPARFEVRAFGEAPLRYQWQFNGLDLPEATNASLTLPNAQPSQAGPYRVIVSSATQTVVSAPARLIVNADPTAPAPNPVLSVNLVGYGIFTVPPGHLAVGRPLFILPGNSAADLFVEVPDGITLFKADGNGFVANSYLNGWADPELPLQPGEGFFLHNPHPTNVSLMTVGLVGQGWMVNHLPAGVALGASTVPQSGPLVSLLGYPAAAQDLILTHEPAAGGYRAYRYQAGGWFPQEPVPRVGEAFWSVKNAAADWERVFFVNFQSGSPGNPYRVAPNAVGNALGQVNLFTWNPDPAKGRVLDVDGRTPLGSAFAGQLYAGGTADDLALHPVGEPARFSDGAGAGWLRGGTVSIPGTPGNQRVCLQLRVWEQARGGTYEAAQANGGRVGQSAVFAATTGAGLLGGLPGLPPPAANDFPTFSIAGAGLALNQPPRLADLPDQWVYAGSTLILPLLATDPDGDPAELVFSLPVAPPGASVDAASGVLTWTPTDAQAPGDNLLTVRVVDRGTPPLGVSQSFRVIVLPRPQLGMAAVVAEGVTLTWPAQPGGRYRIEYTDNLSAPAWIEVPEAVMASSSVGSFLHRVPPAAQRFYRIVLLP